MDGNRRVTSYVQGGRERSGDMVRLADDARSDASLDAAFRADPQPAVRDEPAQASVR